MDEDIVSGGVSTNDWIQAGIIITVAILLAIAINFLSQRAVRRADSELYAARFVGRMLALLAVAAGLVYALSALEVRLGPLLGALGIGGLALAFALQDIIENFAAGVILQIRRPMRRGDQIFSNDYEGTVLEINLRSTILTTFDGEIVYLPNADVLKNPVINYTARGSRRTKLIVGVDYHADLEQAKSVIVSAITRVDGVLEEPAAEAYIHEFGEDSVNLTVFFWHHPEIAELWRIRDAVAIAVKRALDNAGIAIPFPELTLRFPENLRVVNKSKEP